MLFGALDPIGGAEVMARRGAEADGAHSVPGPGRSGAGPWDYREHGRPLSRVRAPASFFWAGEFPIGVVGVSGRIGIREAADRPLRFFLRGHPEVSGRPR